MKNLIVFIFTLMFSSVLLAQDKSEYYYYYKGEKVFLELNTNYLIVAGESKNDVSNLKGSIDYLESETEIREDLTVSGVDRIKGIQNESSGRYWKEISLKEGTISNADYLNQLEKIEQNNENVMALSFFKKGEKSKVGLSGYFYVKLKDEKDLAILSDLAKREGAQIVGRNKFMPLWITLTATKKSANAMDLANTFYETGEFEATEPEFIQAITSYSNDPLYTKQWTLENIGQNNGIAGIDLRVAKAWNITKGDASIRVAVYDQGVDMGHPDMNNFLSCGSYDASTGSSPSNIYGGHGMLCAGIIGAQEGNEIGIAGIAPETCIMPISMNFAGVTDLQMANGMNWAWMNGADVISNSWGSDQVIYSPMLDDAINAALTNGRDGKGTVVVFASGNSNLSVTAYPSNSDPRILCVGGADRCGIRSGRLDIIPESCDPWGVSPGSSYGTSLDVVAGGSSVYSTDLPGNAGYNLADYISFGGTSAACPQVAAIAALVLSVNPNLTIEEVNTVIEQSAKKVRTDVYNYANSTERPNGTWNNELGYGLVNAYQAVLLATCSNPNELEITTDVLPVVEEVCSAVVNWDDVPNAEKYKVKYKEVGGNWITQYANISETSISGLDPDKTYWIKVKTKCQNMGWLQTWGALHEFSCSASMRLVSDTERLEEDVGISLYPNPIRDNVEIEWSASIRQIRLFDLSGREILSINDIDEDQREMELDLSTISKGIYFVHFINSETGLNETKRIVKL